TTAKNKLDSLLRQQQTLTDLITGIVVALQSPPQSMIGFLDEQKKAQLQAQLADLERQLHALEPKIELAEENVPSFQRVFDYVQTGYASGNSYAASSNAAATGAASSSAKVKDLVTAKVEAEKKAAEDKAKQEAEDKEKQAGDDKGTTDPMPTPGKIQPPVEEPSTSEKTATVTNAPHTTSVTGNSNK
ncbi:MAG: hypothetical protein ACXVP5_12970, partial [Tumebacillaceae bacterium]